MGEHLRKFAAAVLVADMTHNRKMQRLDGTVVDPDKLYVELIGIVLDALGVPPDNTVKQSRIYGDAMWDHPGTFCRDWLVDEWFSRSSLLSDSGTDAQATAVNFVDWVLSEMEGVNRGPHSLN